MKDYRDMLSSLKDKVVDAAGKATVAVTDVAGKAVSDEMRDKVAEMEAQMDELRAAAREYRPAPDLHTIDAEEVIDPQDIEVEVTEEPAPEE